MKKDILCNRLLFFAGKVRAVFFFFFNVVYGLLTCLQVFKEEIFVSLRQENNP